MVKTAASQAIGKKLMVCVRAVKWLDEEVKEAVRVRREARARCASSKTTAGWEGYAVATNKVKEMVEKRGVWKDVVNETNEDLDGGVKHMWVGKKGILGKRAGEADTGIATLRARNGRIVCSSKGEREALYSSKLGALTTQRNVRHIREGDQRMVRDERRCIRQEKQWFRRVA